MYQSNKKLSWSGHKNISPPLTEQAADNKPEPTANQPDTSEDELDNLQLQALKTIEQTLKSKKMM
jgi:hypothetical protein